ncbi:AAA family ATPase [Paenibacillus rhizoplanae]|uniref:AAA family ATPase n=1 Tax=Paenibacillus rhizoplanae TaxID=1917181 RepID=A0ABW5FH95_9BACL
MILNKITIENYREFLNSSLSLMDDITLLAGANNSGKTSFIDLLGCIFNVGKTSFCVSDIPVKLSKNGWIQSTLYLLSILIMIWTKTKQLQR